MTIKVGCCGHPVSMKKYKDTFQVVELNSTFYRYPRDSTAERWRRESPVGFENAKEIIEEISKMGLL